MDVHIGQRAQEEGRSITNYLERLITEDALRKTALPHQLRQLGDSRRASSRAKGMLLAARKKRQGQNRLPGLILYDHH